MTGQSQGVSQAYSRGDGGFVASIDSVFETQEVRYHRCQSRLWKNLASRYFMAESCAVANQITVSVGKQFL